MRHLFIINPAAGKPETTWQLEEQLRRVHFPYETAYTRKSGDALRIARAAAETAPSTRWSTAQRALTTRPLPACRRGRATTF